MKQTWMSLYIPLEQTEAATALWLPWDLLAGLSEYLMLWSDHEVWSLEIGIGIMKNIY